MKKFKILTADLIKEMFEKQKGIAYKLNGEATDYSRILGVSTYGCDVSDAVYGSQWIDGYNSYTNSFSHLVTTHGLTTSGSIGTRPAINFSLIKAHATKTSDCGVDRYQFGEYPQTVVDKKTQDKLEDLFVSNNLQKTDKYFTISPSLDDGKLSLYSLCEYELDGKKYVRVPYMERDKMRWMSHEMIKYLPSYWVEVEPITWLVDKELDIALSEKVLFSGIPFNDIKVHESEYGTYITPVLEQYLNRIFRYEINESSLISTNDIEKEKLINYAMDKVYDFLARKKITDGISGAADEIVLTLVRLADKRNIIKKVSSEDVINNIIEITDKKTKSQSVDFIDFENAILGCKLVKDKAKKTAADHIYSKRPKEVSSFHHDDWWEDDRVYYPTCDHLIRRPAENVYWKRRR